MKTRKSPALNGGYSVCLHNFLYILGLYCVSLPLSLILMGNPILSQSNNTVKVKPDDGKIDNLLTFALLEVAMLLQTDVAIVSPIDQYISAHVLWIWNAAKTRKMDKKNSKQRIYAPVQKIFMDRVRKGKRKLCGTINFNSSYQMKCDGITL